MTNYPLLDLFLSMLYFFGWVLWFMLLFWIITDIFRSRDLGGWAKAGWLVFVIVLPLLGVLIYLIARGEDMQERRTSEARARDEEFHARVREAARSDGPNRADDIATLARLHDRGVLSDEQYERAKANVLT